MTEREQLEQAIAAQEALRGILGDAVVDATITVLREKLASLESAPQVFDQRKLVTILFTDTVSSTQMFEHLDPEDVLEIMDGALRIFTEVVGKMGGMVARLMGDGVLAFFGAPVAQEDDAVRAVRCGLGIVQGARAYAAEVESRWGVKGFNVRVGINTGLVALGEVGSAAGSEYTAMGDAINLASRLEHAAPPGSVLISHDTYRHVRGVFEVRTLEPLQVKGKSDPVQVYVVEREKPHTFGVVTRGVDGIKTRMIGREMELKQLQAALEWAIEESETQVVTILGEPGVGKSRLLREFDNWIDQRPDDVFHFAGRATMEISKLPYALIRNVFAFRFEIQDSDSAAVVREKLERGIAGFMGPDSHHKAHYIGQTIGFDFSHSIFLQQEDPQQVVQLGMYYLTEFFAAAAAHHPAVLFLEDIHWADDKSLDLVNYLVRSRRDLRLLVVCLARPTLLERRPLMWDKRHEFHTLIELSPLSKDDTGELVDEILRKVESTPPHLRELIVNSSDGNPFYVEELIKMLIDDGVIIMGADRWRVETARLTDMRIPPTLTGVLQARLDALPPKERIVLQRASVVGRIFWDRAVAELHAEGDEPVDDIGQVITSLRKRELIRLREKSAFAGTEEYIFKHAILRDVTYESVLRRLRRVYHAQVAAWLVERSGDRIGEYTGLIAEHYERAGDTHKAMAYLGRAAEQALNISAYREAINLLERLLALLGEDTGRDRRAQEALIKWQLGQAHRGLSAYAKARELYEDSLKLFKAAEDRAGIVKALYELGWLVGYIMRNHDEGEAYFQDALRLAREIGDLRGIAWALNGLGVLAHWRQRHAEAIRHYEESLELARQIGDQTRIAGALNNLGLVKKELGEYDEARQRLEESLEIFRAIGNRAGIASPLTNLGDLAGKLGQHEKAREYYTEALKIHKEIGNRAGIAGTLSGLGSLARLQGEYEEARQRFVESLAISKEIEYRTGIAMSLEDLALVARFQGNYAEARQRLHEILQIARELGDRREIAEALLNLGAVERAQGNWDEARRYLQESQAMNDALDNRKGVAAALDFLGDVAFTLQDYEEAWRCYETSLAIYKEFEDRSGMVVALCGLGDVAVALEEYDTAREYFYEAFTAASTIRDTPLTLWVLTGIAALLAKTGEQERSVEMLGLVLDHCATPQEARDRAQAILAGLDMPVLEIDSALERGKAMDGVETTRQLFRMADNRWLM
ncbi:MAG: adenylate cyclase [Chloroflexota bacterium]|nr:MAG: adenylate cyclase [Chloroflexota bacterium]